MDDETRTAFEYLTKRLEDLRTWGVALVGAAGTVIAVLALVFTWNFQSEKEGLRDFRDKLEKRQEKFEDRVLGVAAKPAEIELFVQKKLGTDKLPKVPLEGSELPARIEVNEDGASVVVSYVIVNSGGSRTGPMYMKLYTGPELVLEDRSTDEDAFSYEAHFPPGVNDPSELPPGVSSSWYSRSPVLGEGPDPGNRVRGMIKIFYGRNQIATAKFTLVGFSRDFKRSPTDR